MNNYFTLKACRYLKNAIDVFVANLNSSAGKTAFVKSKLQTEQKVHSALGDPAGAPPGPVEDITTWVDNYGDYLMRFAMFRVRQTEIAEDLVQDTFMAAHAARHRFEGKSSVKTWLVTILKNKIVDHFRKANREQDVSSDAMEEDVMHATFNRLGIWKTWLNEWENTPEALTEQQGFLRQFESCLNALPERLRQVFVLRALDNVETDEVCKQLDVSSGNLWVILYRARMQLRNCLEMNWFKKQQRSL